MQEKLENILPWFFLIFVKKVTKGKQLTLFRSSQIDLFEFKIKKATKNILSIKIIKMSNTYCISWIWETLHNCESDNEKWGKNWMTLYEILCKQSSGKSNADLASKKVQQCVQIIFVHDLNFGVFECDSSYATVKISLQISKI